MGKHLKYNLAIFASLLDLAVIFIGGALLAWGIMEKGNLFKTVPGIVLILIGLALWYPCRAWRVQTRRDVEYDEFGISKSKGNYEYLSKKERDQIDLKKTADMERLLSATALKKMTKPGSTLPMKDLQNMIGLLPVKQKIEEMVARMQFEQDELTQKGKKNKQKNMGAMGGRHMCFTGAPGTGKAQPLYSKVLTPHGFVRMGDIKVGDEVISGTNKVAKVLGVYPQGIKPIYEITFDDGSTCRCSDEHLWTVQNRNDRRNKKYRTIELKDMLKSLYLKEGESYRLNYSIDYVEPIDLPEQDFYIHPYLMGAMLGDGHFTTTGTSISVYDPAVKENIENFLPSKEYKLVLRSCNRPEKKDYTIRYDGTVVKSVGHKNFMPLSYELEQFGLRGVTSYNKYIPKPYLQASKEQRWWLLRGLMDTDGYADKTCAQITTVSKQLRDDIIELVHSLGGYASWQSKMGKYTKNGEIIETCLNYRVTIQFPAEYCACFGIDRKTSAYRPKRSHERIKRYITNIQYVGDEECQCIYIDDPSHLYITDNYIITHNTTVARIMTGFLYKYGYIKENKVIEIDGNFLKAGTESALKTELVVRSAYGGVLFIDEAYALMESGDGSGEQAIATLIKQMEDNRDKFILIIAGYTNEMKMLIDQNPGFESRIKEYLDFPDYDYIEMREIAQSMANQNNFCIDDKAYDVFDAIVARERKLRSFGNGRTVRNIVDKAIDRHTLNLARGVVPAEKRYTLCSEDFQNLKLGTITTNTRDSIATSLRKPIV